VSVVNHRGLSARKRAVTACAAFVLLLWSESGAARASAPAPVQLLDCRINHRMSFVDPYRAATIAFVNRGDTTVDDIHFRIRYAGQTADVLDRGSFSKDVNVNHDYRVFWNVPFAGAKPSSCSVEYVHFADGRSWAAESVTP
jgi:hypothetical protein